MNDQQTQPETTEIQEKQQPQFIHWVKENGIFIGVKRLKQSEKQVCYDIESNVELDSEYFRKRNVLELLSSVYLGPMSISQELSSAHSGRDYTERLNYFKHAMVKQIVDLARQVAEDEDATYFGVNIVRTYNDNQRKFQSVFDFNKLTLPPSLVKGLGYKKYPIENPLPLEFTLHPTANLYVPRE
ncbi:hypothetical protein GOV12_05715 [Candidatus Pacearchaeota archaeon]|nr:hypothetical protein [Candidatus Pacearchaeota archaeon]